MPRAIWKGSISFGLVHIPVGLYSAEQRDELSFSLLDQRDHSPIGYERYNKSTGDPVPADAVVKGYEYEDGSYVVVSDEELKAANPKATQTIEIVDFVEKEEIDPVFYDKPYYLAPTQKNSKGYALLRETMRRTKKVGIAKVVIRTRQYLAAVMPNGPVLVLEILRYLHEIRDPAELDVPGEDLKALGITQKELQMAELLVESMVESWDPSKYRDEYREDLLALIERKVAAGRTRAVEQPPRREKGASADVLDIMTLLKRSVEESGHGAPKRTSRGKTSSAARSRKQPPRTRKTA